MMMYLSYHYHAYLYKTPKRDSILTGDLWMREMMMGNHNAFVETFRMPRETFCRLLDKLTTDGGLVGTQHVSSREMLGMFLYFSGHKASSANLQQRFQHSGDTITRHIHSTLKSIVQLASQYIQIPNEGSPTPSQIASNPKFAPYFNKCRMAIDGTHVPVWVKATETAPFHGRKGITMNVLAACNFDLMFTFVLAGWEGTAGDGKVYADALTKGLTLPSDGFDILDAGFALTTKTLTPYRGTRYHLKEYASGRLRPQTKQELFNLRHAQLRNCIERIFGIVKMRFPVLFQGVRYNYKFQVQLVMALCTLHNFIRLHGGRDDEVERQASDVIRAESQAPINGNDRANFDDAPESEEAKVWRDGIAQSMWEQYQQYLVQRRELRR
ncbi:hypothetical protein AaE_014638 [Aphanomyces astaci]|uniref:Uncharacterized protein n=1 Tax=Aphanomyces astaci TaxID=112090 RepID=A0A6A4Z5U5_APHAT|nr:hypothetical protein AaE_014638 [Aphanomyces astaci]